jgi:hypothetical protein
VIFFFASISLYIYYVSPPWHVLWSHRGRCVSWRFKRMWAFRRRGRSGCRQPKRSLVYICYGSMPTVWECTRHPLNHTPVILPKKVRLDPHIYTYIYNGIYGIYVCNHKIDPQGWRNDHGNELNDRQPGGAEVWSTSWLMSYPWESRSPPGNPYPCLGKSEIYVEQLKQIQTKDSNWIADWFNTGRQMGMAQNLRNVIGSYSHPSIPVTFGWTKGYSMGFDLYRYSSMWFSFINHIVIKVTYVYIYICTINIYHKPYFPRVRHPT